jgi:hypothetical protein
LPLLATLLPLLIIPAPPSRYIWPASRMWRAHAPALDPPPPRASTR